MRKLFCSLGFLCLVGFCWAADFAWDFSDCEIKDILFALSLDSEISIVADDTVCGKGDFRFHGKDFDVGFDTFLSGNRLYVEKKPGVWIVSRFRFCEENSDDVFFSLDAFDLLPAEIVEKLSQRINKVITYDVLPSQKISVHFRNLSEADLFSALAEQFGNYEIERSETGYCFLKKNEFRRLENSESITKIVQQDNGLVSVDIRNAAFLDVLEKFFNCDELKKCSFSLLDGGENRTARCVFSSIEVDEALKKVCAQNNFSFIVKDNIYYFFQDKNAKEQLLFGNRSWYLFNLKYVDYENFLPVALKNLGNVETSILNNQKNAFFAKVTENEKEIIENLIEQIDIKKSTYVINLKYIKPSALMEHLPPFVDKSNLYLADDDSVLYFKGTEEAYASLCEQIEICDLPETRITYDLLILQYEECRQNSWASNLTAESLTYGQRNGFSTQLGSVMSLNLNVVSAFGLDFAATLQSSIEDNKTKVFVDTTLHGISGKEINFQNTNTYRYRDNNLDPETGKPIYSGVTKEIISGIQLNILGWVSGDGAITSRVTASVSRQGLDTSAATGNPPSTSEKVVTTEVCTKSGEPVILSGLLQDAESVGEQGMPGISKFPFLGDLFKSKNKNTERSQMIIYMVPHIDRGFNENPFEV